MDPIKHQQSIRPTGDIGRTANIGATISTRDSVDLGEKTPETGVDMEKLRQITGEIRQGEVNYDGIIQCTGISKLHEKKDFSLRRNDNVEGSVISNEERNLSLIDSDNLAAFKMDFPPNKLKLVLPEVSAEYTASFPVKYDDFQKKLSSEEPYRAFSNSKDAKFTENIKNLNGFLRRFGFRDKYLNDVTEFALLAKGIKPAYLDTDKDEGRYEYYLKHKEAFKRAKIECLALNEYKGTLENGERFECRNNLYYNRALVKKIIDDNPKFYATLGQNVEEVIINAFKKGIFGQLLGYGRLYQDFNRNILPDDEKKNVVLRFAEKPLGEHPKDGLLFNCFWAHSEDAPKLSALYKKGIEDMTGVKVDAKVWDIKKWEEACGVGDSPPLITEVKSFEGLMETCSSVDDKKYNQNDYNELGLVLIREKPAFWGGSTKHIDSQILKFKDDLVRAGFRVLPEVKGQPVVYSPKLVDEIINSDPEYYAQFGKTTEEIVKNAFLQNKQGGLLGYGKMRESSYGKVGGGKGLFFKAGVQGFPRPVVGFNIDPSDIPSLSKKYKEAIERLTGKEVEISVEKR